MDVDVEGGRGQMSVMRRDGRGSSGHPVSMIQLRVRSDRSIPRWAGADAHSTQTFTAVGRGVETRRSSGYHTMRSCISWLVASMLFLSASAGAGVTLREKLGQMVMITVTGDSLEETGPSMDTLKSDLAHRLVGGVVMFVWSENLAKPASIASPPVPVTVRAILAP